jgi:cation diffusion facilitator CzcD-associated flavoprotein CzcO
LGRQVGATRRHGDPQALVNDSYGWPQLPRNLGRVVGATGHLVVGGRAQPRATGHRRERAPRPPACSFDDFAEARVAIIGGRQSAYEWAALLAEHGAEHVDVVHRHPVPEFANALSASTNSS